MLKVLNYNQEKQRFELIETDYETIDDAIDAADDWLYSNTNHILFDDKLSTTEEIVSELHEQMKEKELKDRLEFYSKFNPKNHWGDYEGLVNVASEFLEACKSFPKANISVSR